MARRGVMEEIRKRRRAWAPDSRVAGQVKSSVSRQCSRWGKGPGDLPTLSGKDQFLQENPSHGLILEIFSTEPVRGMAYAYLQHISLGPRGGRGTVEGCRPERRPRPRARSTWPPVNRAFSGTKTDPFTHRGRHEALAKQSVWRRYCRDSSAGLLQRVPLPVRNVLRRSPQGCVAGSKRGV